MRELVGGVLDGPDFARTWFAARRRALHDGERVRGPLERVLEDVFFLLEDGYVIDPALRGPDDVTDEALVAHVRVALGRLSALDRPSGLSLQERWGRSAGRR
ncbi:hypothetical protein AB6N23_08015 [Cellulomonas sp. 179-A 9B4 NHS]|uniref:hypothetical protein n=1 Tax=Cellulomonas sp. 179-A 9B4 NHS TaxID=3142379 RepID=UPI00399EEC59